MSQTPNSILVPLIWARFIEEVYAHWLPGEQLFVIKTWLRQKSLEGVKNLPNQCWVATTLYALLAFLIGSGGRLLVAVASDEGMLQ